MKSESWSTLCKSFLRAPGYLKEKGCGGRREGGRERGRYGREGRGREEVREEFKREQLTLRSHGVW